MPKKLGKHAKNPLLYYCLALAAAILLICSKSSPLYPMNDWVDVNCFFTMGRSLLAGLVPYRDLYEQKGPVLYFVYALVALVSRRSYFGVYLLECVTYGLFLYYSARIAALYVKNSLLIYLSVAVECALIAISRAFAHGASVEEMSLFMFAYGLYVVLRAMRKKRTLRFREAFLCGIYAGILFWTKYTMCGFYLGLAGFVLVWYLYWQRDGAALGRTIGAFFAGLGAVSAVVFAYFLANHAVKDLFTVYFYNNIFLYAKQPERSRIVTILACLRLTLSNNRAYTVLFIPALVWLLWRAQRDARAFALVMFCFVGLAVGTYWGGWSISYYGLVFAVFSIFGLIAIASCLMWVAERLIALPCVPQSLTALTVAGMLLLCAVCGRNVYLLGQDRQTLPQYRFAEIIQSVEAPTLLNYGFLDGGFYFTADVIPNCRYFCTLNVNTPEMWQTQRECVQAGEVDFVVTRDNPLSVYQVDSSRYVLVSEENAYFEGKERTYYLYQRADTIQF